MAHDSTENKIHGVLKATNTQPFGNQHRCHFASPLHYKKQFAVIKILQTGCSRNSKPQYGTKTMDAASGDRKHHCRGVSGALAQHYHGIGVSCGYHYRTMGQYSSPANESPAITDQDDYFKAFPLVLPGYLTKDNTGLGS